MPQRRWSWLTQELTTAGHEVVVIAPKPHYERRVTVSQWWSGKMYRSFTSPTPGTSGEKIIRSGFFPSTRSLTGKVINQISVAFGSLWVILRKPAALARFQPDVVIGTVPAIPTAAVTFIAAMRFNAPYVVDLRDAWPDLLENHDQWNQSVGKRSLKERVFRLGLVQSVSKLTKVALNIVLRRAKVVIVTSSRLGEDLSSRKELRDQTRRPLRTVTIRNVFPPETCFVKGEYRKSQYTPLHVLYAGTLGRAQHLENAILAASICRSRGVDVKLRFVGSGAGLEKVKQLAEEMEVSVQFVPRQPAEDLSAHYQWADTALVHLTNWAALDYVVPSKTYELMEAGIHISAVVAGETAALIRDTEAGDVVVPENPSALADLWSRLSETNGLVGFKSYASRWVNEQRDSIAEIELSRALSIATEGNC
ncbi:glycosyltransferase family 4 protein [Corynebacterium hadale]|uniref:glycosyltransferase family 4 protein n=1 Tax=Corynebacterium hadale TaxID=2026255 RepID=UPI001F0A50AE|nr:glycosyltransferase family 4 protein [Corynebacterium hadale]